MMRITRAHDPDVTAAAERILVLMSRDLTPSFEWIAVILEPAVPRRDLEVRFKLFVVMRARIPASPGRVAG